MNKNKIKNYVWVEKLKVFLNLPQLSLVCSSKTPFLLFILKIWHETGGKVDLEKFYLNLKSKKIFNLFWIFNNSFSRKKKRRKKLILIKRIKISYCI